MPATRRPREQDERSSDECCQHTAIQTEPSYHAVEVGYSRPSVTKRAKAQGVKLGAFEEAPLTFPAPLVLPGDDLALDPTYPAQSVLSWTREKARNQATTVRRTIYVVPPPGFESEVAFAKGWSVPFGKLRNAAEAKQSVDVARIADYVRSFYNPLPVKLLPESSFKFASWSSKDSKALKSGTGSLASALIGLKTSSDMIGIRSRKSVSGLFVRQLNLNDLLDVAIASLPDDAYAMVMIVDQDLYEDDDDEFVCGRAYGGSRVAVVSTARYNPAIDASMGLALNHIWPLSHCTHFMNASNTTATQTAGDEHHAAKVYEGSENDIPLHEAIRAVKEFRSHTSEKVSATWLGRMCRTVSHELGHCFGIDHCVYYACCMQGSASLNEDHRQPPYLCPIDLQKVVKATGASEADHVSTMLKYCNHHRDVELFVGYAAWLAARLRLLGGNNRPRP